VIDTSAVFYDGNSQGGILGGALTAVAPDFTRAGLGVPAMRFSMLLPRATPFDQFAAVLYPNYPDELARPLVAEAGDLQDCDGAQHARQLGDVARQGPPALASEALHAPRHVGGKARARLLAVIADVDARLELLLHDVADGRLRQAVEVALLERNPQLARAIRNRFPYVDPLNYVQLELLKRYRNGDTDERVVQGIHLTINGIAAGLRNSG